MITVRFLNHSLVQFLECELSLRNDYLEYRHHNHLKLREHVSLHSSLGIQASTSIEIAFPA